MSSGRDRPRRAPFPKTRALLTPDGWKLATNLEGPVVETPDGPVVLTPDGPKVLAPTEPEPQESRHRADSPGGRRRKKHPGIALREAARMIVNEEGSDVEVAREATAKARQQVTNEELTAHHWGSGFTSRDDVPKLQAAISAGLVQWTPKALRLRAKSRRAFRDVDDSEWLEIPQPE